MRDVECFVLAGGLSTRMGQDKSLLTLDGTTLLERTLLKLSSLSDTAPRIAGARDDLAHFAEVVKDQRRGCGPLGGIEAALAASKQPLNLFLPVDVPLIPARFLVWMLDRARITGALMTVPRLLGRPQPLCAIYHRDLLEPIRVALEAGNYRVMAVTSAAAQAPGSRDVFDVERVAAAWPELTTYDSLPFCRWFHNCNTPQDLAATGML